MSVRFELCDPWSIAPYAAALGRLERAITYPLGDGRERFFIDHGDDYHSFFSGMGEAYFLVALHDRTPVGVVAGVLKRGERDGRSFESAYVCDLKLDPAHRGHGIAAALLRRALVLSATTPSLRRWRFGYGAAMRGDRGDVLRSARGPLHPAKLTARWASMRLWFVEPKTLAGLDPRGCPENPASVLDLSPRGAHGENDQHNNDDDALSIESTMGRKDLRLASNGASWPLWHLARSPARFRVNMAEHLASVGRSLLARGAPGLVCWALDERLRAHVAWLAGRGLASDTVCTVYGLSLPGGPARGAPVHLATSEI